MDGREVGSHHCESKPDAPEPHRYSIQPLHAKSNGHHLSWRGQDGTTLYVRHNCLCWHLVTNKATVRGLSADSPDIPTRLGSSLHLLFKRLTQQGGIIFIRRYCGNSRWRIAEQTKRYWNRSRATRHRTRPILHCDKTSVTAYNHWSQSSRRNKNHQSWRGCLWRLAPRCTLSQDLHIQRDTFGCQPILPQQDMVDSTRCHHQGAEGNDSEDAQIGHNAYIETIQGRRHVWAVTHQGDDIQRYNGRAV